MSTDTLSKLREEKYRERHKRRKERKEAFIRENGRKNRRRSERQGHWIISSDGYYPYCSECKSEPKNGEMTDVCPNCGADMRGAKND